MSIKRSIIRAEAKKLYKEQVKGVPKKQRVSFSEFFKRYQQMKSKENSNLPNIDAEEDFDIEDMVNVNTISDDDLDIEDENS